LWPRLIQRIEQIATTRRIPSGADIVASPGDKVNIHAPDSTPPMFADVFS